MKLWIAALLVVGQLEGGDRFAKFGLDLEREAPRSQAAIINRGRVIWQNGEITAPAPAEPVIAEGIARALLDSPAPTPPGATIRQVLMSMADGTPGEEILENLAFFEALHTVRTSPNAVEFAKKAHGTLGWFVQGYAGEPVYWSYGPSLLIVRLPSKRLTLVASGNFTAARLEEGNVARSTIALAFFKDVARMQGLEPDESIDQAFLALSAGNREGATTLARSALNRFPELESTPDVTLLYLFSQLDFPETEASATAVIKAHPSLPTAWFYYGEYLEKNKRYREAAACFEKITTHEPPWHNWTVAAAKKELTHLKTY